MKIFCYSEKLFPVEITADFFNLHSVVFNQMYLQIDREDGCLQPKHPLPFRAQIAFCDL